MRLRRVTFLSLPAVLATSSLLAGGIPSLCELGASHHLLVGTAVKAAPLKDLAPYRETLLRQFNIITPANEMKWKSVRPREGAWNFQAADFIVNFARDHGLVVRGHNLVWNGDSHAPAWLLAESVDPDNAERLLREHIITVMRHFRGRVRDWDVVNEAIANDNRPGASVYNDGFWFRSLGDKYVALAFRIAREADPEAGLFYNDYDHGNSLGPKSDRIYHMLAQLRADKVPIDGVGLQMHCSIDGPPSKDAMIENFHRLAALGLRVQVTELDVDIMSASGTMEERLEQQAKVYRNVFEAALESRCVEAVVMWGFTDKFRQNALLSRKKLPSQETPMWIFDPDFRPKPTFTAIAEVLSKFGE